MNPESNGKDRREETAEPERRSRRDFLAGLGKWSAAVIGGVVGGAAIGGSRRAAARVSRCVNRRVGGGAWANRAVGGGAWANRRVGGGAWVNRRVGGGAWVNRR